MKLFKNYKKLYEIEVSNRKILEDRKKELYDKNIEYQIEIQDQTNEIRTLKEEVAKLKIELEDLQGFKNNENGVAIVNYQSGATGINDLCIAHYGIFYSPTEDYILFAQAKARLDRIGQTKQPVFYYLVTKGSVESAIYRSLKRGESFDASIFCSWLEENNNGIRKSD